MLPEKDLLTTKEVAAYLGYHPRSIRNWIRAGKFPAIRVGREYRIRRVDLEQFLEEQRIDKQT